MSFPYRHDEIKHCRDCPKDYISNNDSRNSSKHISLTFHHKSSFSILISYLETNNYRYMKSYNATVYVYDQEKDQPITNIAIIVDMMEK